MTARAALLDRLEEAVEGLEVLDHLVLLVLQAEKLKVREERAKARSLPAGDVERMT